MLTGNHTAPGEGEATVVNGGDVVKEGDGVLVDGTRLGALFVIPQTTFNMIVHIETTVIGASSRVTSRETVMQQPQRDLNSVAGTRQRCPCLSAD